MSSYRAFEVAKNRFTQVQSQRTEISEKTMSQNQKQTAPLKNLGFSTQNQKKLYLIWSLDDQAMASQIRTAKLKINLVRLAPTDCYVKFDVQMAITVVQKRPGLMCR